MGAEHGAYCVGCCWLMMTLLFVGGAMNLYWIGGLAGYALAEKLLPAGERVARVMGASLIAGGLALLASAGAAT